ncbi:MAG TPA: LysR family transcriptional regulator [Dokdonella sp.]|nr:LysR family transcriptional regulator [Dokdonella sp.]HNS27247.1 LysR family transcriptional regulator [Steroidobacteraceae bacterium]
MRLDLDAMEALEAVVRCGGLARAAEELHKVPSAVSYQLRRLEQQLRVALVDREGYRVRLTPVGEVVLAQGRRLLAQARQVESLARQFADAWEPRLLVIVDGILPVKPTLTAFNALSSEGAPTRFQVKVEFQRGVQFCFERDDADLMVVKDYDPKPYLVAKELAAVECILCVGRRHPLAAQRSVSLEDLQDYVELSVQDSSGKRDDPHGFGGERVFHLSGFDAKKQALLMGAGFGWMPHGMVRAELRAGRLRELRYAGGSRYRFTPRLVHRLDRPPGRAGRRLAQLLREASGKDGDLIGHD